jgi:signal transduction histidine kinase/CheY-like chemotaxis protein
MPHRTLDDIGSAHAIEARYRVTMFRAIVGVTLLVHASYILLINRVTPLHAYLTAALTLSLAAAVEFGSPRLWRGWYRSRHLHAVGLVGVVYTLNLGVAVARGGGAADSPATWWMSVYPFYVILAGSIRLGLVLLGCTLAWFFLVFIAVAQGWLPPAVPQPSDAVRGLAAATGSSAVLGLFIVMSVRRRFELRDALLANMRRLEQEREQARADANAKTMLLANISHELRTPLNGVIGMAELLATPELAPGQQRQLLGLMRQSADILTHLVDDVLDYAKLEAGRMHTDRMPLDVRATAFSVIELFAPRAHAKGIEIGGFFTAQVPFMIEGDATRLRQILANFVSNAVKFTERGGVHLHVDVVHPGGDEAGPWLHFTVSDSGIGMSEAAMAGLFTPYVQANESIARRYGGTGLGLSICKQLAERMGGHVSARSEPGVGSVFTLALPLVSLPGPGSIDYPPPPPLAGVCLVSGNAFVQQHVAELLSLHCIDLRCADRLEPAELAALPPRSVLVVDAAVLAQADAAQQLPAAARQMQALGSLPIVLNTTVSRDAPLSITGAVVMLFKPLRLSRFLAALAQALDMPSEDVPDPHAARSPATPLAGMRVLLADDNAVNQIIAGSMLEQLGALPVVAGSGRQTLECLATGGFDILLLDCEMPEMDGFEVARRWREIERAEGRESLPIIAVTGRSRREAWPACAAAGMDDFLNKPFLREQLALLVRTWVSSQPTRVA